VKRGEIWIVSGRGSYTEMRPAVIIQEDIFDATGSIMSQPTDAPLFRLPI
jgi:mRNA interferase MazF